MKTVKKSVLIWYSPAEMYRLVTDVDQYPQFLPWCDKARVVSHEENGMLAEIGIAFSGIHQTFSTRNVHVVDRQVIIHISTAMDKTAVIAIEQLKPHPMYRKIIRRTKTILVHDPEKTCQVGDLVRVMETRPLSKRKRWRFLATVRKAVE